MKHSNGCYKGNVFREAPERTWTLYEKLVGSIGVGLSESLRLDERLHIVDNFDECINDIVDNWIAVKGRVYGRKYTGWVYDIYTKACDMHSEEYQPSSSEYKIYVDFYVDYTDDSLRGYAAVRGVEVEDAHHAIVIGYNNGRGNLHVIKSRLKHEFTHIREQYAVAGRNVILNDKNMADNIDNDWNLSNNDFAKIKDFLYFVSPTEQHARINEFHEYLKGASAEDIERQAVVNKGTSQYNLYRQICCVIYDDITKVKSFVRLFESIKMSDDLCGCLLECLRKRGFIKEKKERLDDYTKQVLYDYVGKLMQVTVDLFDQNGIADQLRDWLFDEQLKLSAKN